MKTLFRFYGLLALAALLIVSCIQDPLVEEPVVSSIQVTVSAGIASEPSTKSEVAIEDGARVLKFTEGDRLYVYGEYDASYELVKGMLTMVENSLAPDGKSAKFSGSLQAYNGLTWVKNPNFEGNDPLESTTAILIHKDMVENRDYQFVTNNGALSVIAKPASDVETLMTKSLRVTGDYDSSTKSFALSGGDAIFNSVFTGLAPSTNYYCQLRYSLGEGNGYVTSGNHSFTTDANGINSHAFCLQNPDSGEHPWEIEIKQNGTTIGTIPLGTRTLEKKIYNVRRWWNGSAFCTPTNLATIDAAYTAINGEILTGTLDVANHPVKISIAAGATVTLHDVTINGVDNDSYPWAGITCLGDATINLSGTNTVTGFYKNYPGIQAAHNDTGSGDEYTLTIQGTGSLTASCNSSVEANGNAAGIGGGYDFDCGNIVIAGGSITANGGTDAAGIGGGPCGNCGTITISGGTVIARCAGEDSGGPGIGSGSNATCGDITISGGNVTATAGIHYAAGIGTGGTTSECGNITIIGGIVVATGSYYGPGIGAGDQNCSCGDITVGAGITSVTAIRGSLTHDADISVPGDTDAPCIGKVSANSHCRSVYFDKQLMFQNGIWVYWPISGSDYDGLHIVISQTNKPRDTWTLTPAMAVSVP